MNFYTTDDFQYSEAWLSFYQLKNLHETTNSGGCNSENESDSKIQLATSMTPMDSLDVSMRRTKIYVDDYTTVRDSPPVHSLNSSINSIQLNISSNIHNIKSPFSESVSEFMDSYLASNNINNNIQQTSGISYLKPVLLEALHAKGPHPQYDFDLNKSSHNTNNNSLNDGSKIYSENFEDEEQVFFDEKAENNYEIMMNLPENCTEENNVLIENLDGTADNRKGEKANECKLCERKYVYATGLAKHMKKKHSLGLIPSTKNKASSTVSFENTNRLNVMVKCTACGRVFFSPENAMDHFNENHQIKNATNCTSEEINTELQNQVVNEEFMNTALEYLNSNLEAGSSTDSELSKDHFKVIILQCEFCDFIFTDVANLLKHSATHDPLRVFECNSCKIYVDTFKEIFLHYQTECVFPRELERHNLQKLFVCNVCENRFRTLEQLIDHRYSSSLHLFPRLNKTLNILQICCEYCGSIFENAVDISKHHVEKHFKKSENRSCLKRGLRIPGPRKYLCDVCGKSYIRFSDLQEHYRYHRKIKSFACTEPDCDRKFTIRQDLKDHIRKCHTGERPFHCIICDKRFLTGSVFYQHRQIHTGERRYGCEMCDKRFTRSQGLKNHLKIHTGEKPYACCYCFKNFRQKGILDRHIRAKHADLDAKKP